ncbi:MAG TPA: hypothetical protein PLO88_02905 [Bacilli bacterium]|nr:MAG: hypothetical protein BWY97_00347 [Tenericutes bacterium ADurb.BinA124]HPN61065.1 hypothetical protein [Bacilli bacterium]HPX85013.1 hypothetical protein [Bacilli bacterium]
MAKKQATKKPNRLITIKRYALAAANLYGVIKLEDFIKIFNHYEKEPLTEEEAITMLELLSSISEDLVSYKQGIFANGLFYLYRNKEFQIAKGILQALSHRPRYLPAKEEFLKFENEQYIEPMEPLLALERFIIKNELVKNGKPDEIRFDVLDFHYKILLQGEPSDYMNFFQMRGYEFKDEMQVNIFIGLIIDLHNNTRSYEHCGHTPAEVGKIME